jgi:hypothetical protein
MIIRIIEDGLIEVFGDTKEEVSQNNKDLMTIIGKERWVSTSGMLYGPLNVPGKKYKLITEFIPYF